MRKLTTCLWFDNKAEQAAKFYTSIFKNSKIKSVSRYGEAAAKVSGQRKGSAMTVSFEIDGQQFLGLNGGPHYRFSPAISFIVNCKTQREIDELWDKLSRGGKKDRCGWLHDKYGVTWQIVPTVLGELMQGGEPGQGERVMAALLQMTKLDIAALKRAARQR